MLPLAGDSQHLPLLLTLKRCAPAEHEAISAVLKTVARLAECDDAGGIGEEELDLTPVYELLEKYRGVEDTIRRAEKHVARAEAAIAPFPDCRAKEDMLAALRYSVSRDR